MDQTIIKFKNQETVFGVRIPDVSRILQLRKNLIIPIPKSSNEILGFYEIKKSLIPIIDLMKLKDLEDESKSINPEDTKHLIPALVVQFRNIPIILTLPSEPKIDDNTLLDGEENSSEEEVVLIDIENLFKNIRVTDAGSSNENSTIEDELDLSQYLLDEE